MYEGFKAALDSFTSANEDVCRPVEHHIEAIHKLMAQLADAGAQAQAMQNAGGQVGMREQYVLQVGQALTESLNTLIGITMNMANMQDAVNRKRGQLIVAKGRLSPVKSSD
jgi:hypothetical protein